MQHCLAEIPKALESSRTVWLQTSQSIFLKLRFIIYNGDDIYFAKFLGKIKWNNILYNIIIFNVYSAWHIVVTQQNNYYHYNSSSQSATSVYASKKRHVLCYLISNKNHHSPVSLRMRTRTEWQDLQAGDRARSESFSLDHKWIKMSRKRQKKI